MKSKLWLRFSAERREEEEGRERRERGKEKKKREEDWSQPAAGAARFGFASEASAIFGVSNELFGFSMGRPKHWLHPWAHLPATKFL